MPKPRTYPRVIYPEKKYISFESEACPFRFNYPNYAKIIKESRFFDESVEHLCWMDIHTEVFDCRIHCSYYPIGSPFTFDRLIADAFKLAGKHTIKADYIDEQYFENRHGVAGFVFKLTGPVASPYQFFVTDSTRHFLRGSLYFNTQARPDSLRPIVEFMKTDLDTMLQSFQWVD